VDNFPISGLRVPPRLIHSLGLIKACAAEAHAELQCLDSGVAAAITAAALEVADGAHDEQFPVDVFQTGSGTSRNMNANEVIARLASRRLDRPAHPNNHVNLGQSSNDVIPTAIHVSTLLASFVMGVAANECCPEHLSGHHRAPSRKKPVAATSPRSCGNK
jgi:fumarate hydratase class II